MLFVPEVWQDIRKYYEGAYVKFLEFGDTLFFIERVREHEVVGRDETDEAFVLTLDSTAPYNLTYTIPHKGLFMFNGVAHMLYRVPAVQYSRGLTSSNTKIIEVPTGKPRSINFDILKAYVQKQPYKSLDEALFSKNNDVSVCLSRRLSFYRPKQMLFVDAQPIVSFRRKDSTLVPTTSACRQFYPELKSLISEGSSHPVIKFE